MEICFKNKKLKKSLTTAREMVAKHGPRRAKLIQQRLSEIEAGPNLKILGQLPGPRLHGLKGNRRGIFSVDLDHPYRLLFLPDHTPVPELVSGGPDLSAITQVKVLEIADTHE